MKKFYILFFFLIGHLQSTYLVRSNNAEIYYHLMLHDEPRNLFSNPSAEIENAIWIPSMLWQCAALHLFFKDPCIQKSIKEFGYRFNLYDPEEHLLFSTHPKKGTWPSNFDEKIVETLKTDQGLEEIQHIFDCFIHYEGLPPLFFAFNNHALNLYLNHEKDSRKMLIAILDDLPYDQFQRLPFYHRGKKDVECLAMALKSKKLMLELLDLEIQAFKENKIVFYRGYKSDQPLFPNPINEITGLPHALSFGTTLLGGLYFSTDACALRYLFNEDLSANRFFSLKVEREHLKGNHCLFRFAPLHPFLQLFCEGEFFHAHTKVPAKHPTDFTEKPLHGYYAKCNSKVEDRIGYVFTFNIGIEGLTQSLDRLFQREGCLHFVDG